MKLVNAHIHALLLLLVFEFGFQEAEAQVWTMQQCIDTAKARNISLRMGRNNIAMGEQLTKEAKSGLIPRVTASAEYKYFTNLPYQLMPLSTFNPKAPEGQFKEAQFGVPHNINASLQFSMPLYNPQAYGAISTSKIASELTGLQYQKSEEQIYFEIANLYYNTQILHHQLAFIDSNLANAERLLKNMQLLNEQLLAKATDVSKVKLQVAQLSTQKENISGKYVQVLNALKFIMDIPIEQNLQIDPYIRYQDINEYPLSTTTDIRITRAQNRLLLSELSALNKSMFLPSLHLIGMYGTTGFGYDKQPDDFLKFYPTGFAGIQLSYPLFTGTAAQRKINRKKLEIQNNELQTGLLAGQTNMQVQNATIQKDIAKKTVETTNEQIQLAQNIFRHTVLQQQQGTAGLTEVLLADNALREAQQTYLAAVVDYLKADLELKKLTGNISTTNWHQQ